MNTKMPKVLHAVCGRPMLEWVLEACRDAGVQKHIVVVGYGKEQIMIAIVEVIQFLDHVAGNVD